MFRQVVWVAVVGWFAGCDGCDGPASSVAIPLGEIIGHVEIDQEIPQPGARIRVEGTPRSAKADNVGQFDLIQLDPGKWTLQVVANEMDSNIPSRRITTAANGGFVTDLGAIRIAPPGQIGGHVTLPPGTIPPAMTISIPGFAVATSPDPVNFGYVLDRVPVGVHEVVLTTASGDVTIPDVRVLPNDITLDINFDLADLQQTSINVTGAARVSGSEDRRGILIELVETVGGTVVASTATGEDGTFALPGTSGVYL